MKFINKILIVLIIIMFLLNIFNQVYALNFNNYKPTIENDDPTVKVMANKIIGAFKIIGTIISVIALIIIGIKYMLSSVEEKAANKESFVIYTIGAVLIFGISNIVQVIYDWAIAL